MCGDYSLTFFLFDVLLKCVDAQFSLPDVVHHVHLKDTYVKRVMVSNVHFHQKVSLVPFM